MCAGALLFAGLLSAPPVQGWLVRRLIATQPGWSVNFLKFGVSPNGLETNGLDFAMPGVSAKSAPIAVRIAPLRLFSRRELRIERLEAQKLNLVITPAQLADTPAGAPAAAPFDGALRLLQSPLSWAIDNAQLDGVITVNDAGQSLVIGEFTLQGGGFSSDQPGTFTYTLAVNSAVLPPGPDNRVHSTGTIRVTPTSDHGVASIVIEGDVTLPHYGPLVLPPAKLTLTVTAAPHGETYHAKLAFGPAGEFEFNGRLDATQSVLTGRAGFRADQSLVASLAPGQLPTATASGTADLVLDLTTNDLEATLAGDLDAADWGKVMPELALVDAFKGHLAAVLTHRGGKLLVKKLAASLQGATSPAHAQLALTQPFDPLALPATPLASLELTHWPAAWANPFLADTGVAITAGEFSGQWSAALIGEKLLQLRTLRPAALTGLTVQGEKIPALPVVAFAFRPQLDLTADQATVAIADFTATTAQHDRLTARLDATYTLATEALATHGELRGELPSLLAGADRPLPFALDARWDATLTGDQLQLRALEFNARRDATATPGFSVQLLRPLVADIEKFTAGAQTTDAGDWLRVRFTELPLDWLTRWLDRAKPGYAFTGTFAAGESVLRPTSDQGFEFATLTPWRLTGTSLSIGGKEIIRGELTVSPGATRKGEAYSAQLDQLALRDGDGNQLTGRITSEVTLNDRRGRARFDLAADLPALPHSAGTFGPLTATLQAELHNENEVIAAMDAFDLRVHRGDAELLSVVAPAPFVFGFSRSHMFSFSTVDPLRIKTGEIPLTWLRPFMTGPELDGTLQPADFLLSASLTKFQLRPLKPVHVRNFAARLGPTELVRDTEFSFYPGADLTFILVTLPKFQLAYNGTAHVTDGTLVVNGQPAATVDLALGYLGNDELILPNSLELSARVDFAPLARLAALQGRGLPPRGTLVTRLNGSMLGSTPLEFWSRIEGVPAADGQRTLPALEVTAHGKVRHKTKRFDADVSVLLATAPQPTDMHFDVSLNLRDANLHFASAFRSRFIDAAELLAYATAFQPTAVAPATATLSPSAIKPVAGIKPLSPQLGTPFWSTLRGHFDLDIGAVQYAPYRIDGVKGRLDLADRELVLSQLSGEMFAGRWGGTLRVDYDPAVTTGDHRLRGDFHIEQFESARVVQTVFPNQVASVDARINVDSTLTSQGNLLLELIDRTEGSFTVAGAQGVMRLTVPKQDMMATAVVFGGTVLLSPELRAMGRLLRQFSEMPLDQLRITGRRTADGTVSLDEFRFDSPQARLLGRGRIPPVEGEPLMNRPLELSLDLAAKDEVAVILGGMNLIEKKPRADGYRPMKESVFLGGKAGEPDTRPLYDLLAKAVSGSKGTWGLLMRKLQAEVKKSAPPPATPPAPRKTAAATP